MKTLITTLADKWLTIFTTWLGVYPLLTLIAWLLEPVLVQQHPALRSLIMSLLMVPVMVLVVMPGMQWLMSRLHQSNHSTQS